MKKRLTLEKLKEILKARGFTVVVKPDGSTSLRGKTEQATPALMRALAYWREELIAELRRGQSSLSKDSLSAAQTPLASE